MPYNLDIPGQVSEYQLQAIEAVASLVPDGGCIVEVGSLFGRSSWAWAKSVSPKTTVYCVDPWDINRGVEAMERQYGIVYGLEQFQKYTADCPNIEPVMVYSPMGIKDWTRPVDLYYEDAVHANPILDQNIEFWTSHLTPNGIVCGDDYRPRFDDVRAAAHRCAEERGRKLWIVDFFWCVLPDETAVPAAVGVAKILAKLSEQAEAANVAKLTGTKLQVVPLVQLPQQFNSDGPSSHPIRISNNGLTPWPAKPKGELKLYKRLLKGGKLLAEEKVAIGVDQLRYDEALEVPVKLPFGKGTELADTLELGLVGRLPGGASMISLPIKIVSPPKYEIGTVVKFGGDAELPLSLGEGWSVRETNYVWSTAGQSDITVHPASERGQKWVNLFLAPLVIPTDPVRNLDIAVDGKPLLSCRLTGQVWLSLPITLREKHPVRISLVHGNPIVPRDSMEGSTDRRQLSVRLMSLSITDQPQ